MNASSPPDRARRRGLRAAIVLVSCALAWPAAASAAPPLQTGSEGPRVAALQRAFGVQVDGVFGAELRRAVMALQRANGLRADGTVGPATWGLLERIRARARANRRAAERSAPRRISRRIALDTRRAGIASRADRGLRRGIRTIVARRAEDKPGLPLVVRRVIAAADRIATMPYRYGGGHGNFEDSGYDCSGSVSYALHGGGLLDVALASGGFMSWGEPGPGRYISIYASPGHMFMVVAGRRFDTTGRRQTGTRWQPANRGAGAGYVVRHPAGL